MKKLIAIILTVLTLGVFSQDTTQSLYIPDHPGYAYNARLVGLHMADVEFAMGYGNPFNLPNLDRNKGMVYNTTYFRYGAFKHLEFRAGFESGWIPKDNVYGFSGFNFGVKIPIITDVKNAPDIAIVATTYVPQTGVDSVGGQFPHYAPNATLVLQYCFFDRLVLFGNGGIFYDGFDTRMQYSAAFAAYYFFKPNWAFFGETYCRFNTWGNPTNLWDSGILCYINDNLQWDLSFGTNYVTGLDNAFVNSGISWRITGK